MNNYCGRISFWQSVTILGDVQFWIGAATTSLILYSLVPKKLKGHLNWFIFGVLPSIVISWGSAELLKRILDISRPCVGIDFCPSGFSFPSGHAAVIFSAMTVATLYSKKKKLRFVYITAAVLVALSRLFLNVHSIEDVVVGGLLGIVVGYSMYKNYREVHDLISKSLNEVVG